MIIIWVLSGFFVVYYHARVLNTLTCQTSKVTLHVVRYSLSPYILLIKHMIIFLITCYCTCKKTKGEPKTPQKITITVYLKIWNELSWKHTVLTHSRCAVLQSLWFCLHSILRGFSGPILFHIQTHQVIMCVIMLKNHFNDKINI